MSEDDQIKCSFEELENQNQTFVSTSENQTQLKRKKNLHNLDTKTDYFDQKIKLQELKDASKDLLNTSDRIKNRCNEKMIIKKREKSKNNLYLTLNSLNRKGVIKKGITQIKQNKNNDLKNVSSNNTKFLPSKNFFINIIKKKSQREDFQEREENLNFEKEKYNQRVHQNNSLFSSQFLPNSQIKYKIIQV